MIAEMSITRVLAAGRRRRQWGKGEEPERNFFFLVWELWFFGPQGARLVPVAPLWHSMPPLIDDSTDLRLDLCSEAAALGYTCPAFGIKGY